MGSAAIAKHMSYSAILNISWNTWMATKNCYYKILLKASLTASSFFVTFSAKIRTTAVNLYWTI